MKVLRGGVDTIRRCRPVIVAEVHGSALERQRSSQTELLQTFVDLGYTCCVLQDGRVVPYHAEHFNADEIHNVIAVPAER